MLLLFSSTHGSVGSSLRNLTSALGLTPAGGSGDVRPHLARIDARLLDSIGATWAGRPSGSGAALRAMANGPLGVEARGLCDDGDAGVLVHSTECSSLTVPFWLSVASALRVVVPLVHPSVLERDLAASHGLPPAMSRAVWAHHLHHALADAPDALIVDLNRLATKFPEEWEALSARLDLSGPAAIDADLEACASSLASATEPGDEGDRDAHLLFERLGASHLAGPSEIPPEIDDQLVATIVYATGARRPGLGDETERLRRQLAIATAAYETNDAEIAELRSRVRDLEAEYHKLNNARSIRLARAIGDPIRAALHRRR